MNNLPLQPLVWFEREDGNMCGNIKHCAQGAGIFYTTMPIPEFSTMQLQIKGE